MRVALFGGVLNTVLAAQAHPLVLAANVRACDRANVGNVVEPWDKNTRSFYGGRVRIAYIDTGGEPVCGSGWLVVLAPDPHDETGGRSCSMIGKSSELGFFAIDFRRIVARYDSRKGLMIKFPASVDAVGPAHKSGGFVTVRVNVSTGRISTDR